MKQQVITFLLIVSVVAAIDCSRVRCKAPPSSCPTGQSVQKIGCCHICAPKSASKQCPTDCASYFDGCNVCQCDSDGKIGACTKKFCTKPGKAVCRKYNRCPKGCKSWFDGCNTCQCAGVGKLGGCTRKMCIALAYKPEKCLKRGDTSSGTNPCDTNPCKKGETCKPEPKHCIRAPCPQYVCVPGGKGQTANVVIQLLNRNDIGKQKRHKKKKHGQQKRGQKRQQKQGKRKRR